MGDKTIPYGRFIGAVVSFLIVALVLYLFIVKLQDGRGDVSTIEMAADRIIDAEVRAARDAGQVEAPDVDDPAPETSKSATRPSPRLPMASIRPPRPEWPDAVPQEVLL